MGTPSTATKTIQAPPGQVPSNDFNLFQTWLKTQLSAFAKRLLPANPNIGQTATWNGRAWVASNETAPGIDQLTGDVNAGPGSGSQIATVVGLQSLAVPTPPGTGTTVLADISGAYSWATPASLGFGTLAIPGSLVAPPSVAGGGWSFVNNTGSPIASAADVAYGIQLTCPSGTPPANLGFVRAISGSSTASVEVGLAYVNNRTLGDGGPQQMYGGAMMYESSSGKYLAWQRGDYEDASGNSRPFLYLIGTEVGGVTVGCAFGSNSQVFLRMRLDGAGHVICEFSIDRIGWLQMDSRNVTAAFTTAPTHVGIPLSEPLSSGTQVTSLFHFKTT